MDKEIELYSTPTCAHCGKVRAVLDNNQVEYKEYNVKKDREKLKEMVRETKQNSVPVIKIGEKTIVGSNIPRIKRLIKKKQE